MSLESIKFSYPESVPTRSGIKFVRKWKVPKGDVGKAFWVFWKENKLKMLGRGFTVAKNARGQWELQEWKDKQSEFKEYKRKPDIVMESSLQLERLKYPEGLRDFQIPAVEQLVASIKTHGAALDGSATGVGKTYSAIGVARELGKKVGVICPKSVIDSWKRVITNHFKLEYEFVLNYEALKGNANSHIVEKIRKERSFNEEFVWNVPADTLLIFDESHRLKGQNTLNSELATAARKQRYDILCCSATNAIDPLELNCVGYILGLHRGGLDFYKFLKKNDCEKGVYSWEFKGSSYVLKRLHKEIFLNRGVRLVKEDIPGFPESDIITEPYTIDDDAASEINRLYFEMHRELEELKKKSVGDTRGMEMTIRLRSRQKIELLKVPLLVEQTEDLIEDGHSVVIMVNFTETIKALSKKLHTNCIVWGENKETERQDNIDAFQADEQRIILVNTYAGGTGCSFHDLNGKHSRVALISPNDSAPVFKQALGRVHRDGSKTKSQQRILYISNTVEEDVCNNIRMKLRSMEMINDGDLNTKTKLGIINE